MKDNKKILTEQEQKFFKSYFTKCEYDDECSNCDNPKDGSYATGYDSYSGEIDDVFCGECAKEMTPKLLDNMEKQYASYERDLTKHNEKD